MPKISVFRRNGNRLEEIKKKVVSDVKPEARILVFTSYTTRSANGVDDWMHPSKADYINAKVISRKPLGGHGQPCELEVLIFPGGEIKSKTDKTRVLKYE